MKARLAIVVVAWLALPASAGAQGPNDVVKAAIEGYVEPAYDEFHERAGELAAAVGRLCDAPSPEGLDGARTAYGQTVAAWSRIELLRLGPVTEDNRLERILFWPDRKGTGLKQVQAALASEDPSAADAGSLAAKSVAMQGLGAMEFVLFGTGAETLAGAGGYRCAYGAAIAQNLSAIARAVAEEWRRPDGYAGEWSNPGATNPHFRDETEALNELLGVYVDGLELVRDQRLGFLGATGADDRPKQALFWRSGLTVEGIAANLAGLSRLFEASGIADGLPADQAWIASSIRFEFANAARAAEGVHGSIDEVLRDPARRDAVAYLGIVTSSLSELFGTRLAPVLGLTAGFSSLDGD